MGVYIRCCKNCKERTAECHSTCKKYLAEREENEARRNKHFKERDGDVFFMERTVKKKYIDALNRKKRREQKR